MALDTFYHVTVLSNFAQAFDKYHLVYDKSQIPQRHFPNQFFVLTESELHIGIAKASQLLKKLAIPNNQLMVLIAQLDSALLKNDHQSGIGQYLSSDKLPLVQVALCHSLNDVDVQLKVIAVEEAYALSLQLLNPNLLAYQALQPRTFSVLPIAQACQASCRFCFSESSASVEQIHHKLDLEHLKAYCQQAKHKNAERFVITGGGESGLLPHQQLLQLIQIGHEYFKRVTLITNGVHLAKQPDPTERLKDYQQAGLSVLAMSRHHYQTDINEHIMGIDTQTERVLSAIQNCPKLTFTVRLICVLQQGGIDDLMSLQHYLSWAVEQGVSEVCFKELYVSTFLESMYHQHPENQWARTHQVSLSLVMNFCESNQFEKIAELPWKAPIYQGIWQGKTIKIAIYTEPSLFWERTHGIARSWNYMANGDCLASLEDASSYINCDSLNDKIPVVFVKDE